MVRDKTCTFITLISCPSTQEYIIHESQKGFLEEYTVVYTDNQTDGKGQGTHKWESEKGKDISFSLLLYPSFLKAEDQYLLTKMVALAIKESIEHLIGENKEKVVRIKWPNDIYVNKNKIAGILSNCQIDGEYMSKYFVGIGINVNQENFLFAPNPTSLLLETGLKYDLKKVLEDVLNRIKNYYILLKNGQLKGLNEAYLKNLLYIGERHHFVYKGEVIEGKIEGVNQFGHLIIKDLNQKQYTCQMGEVKLISNDTDE